MWEKMNYAITGIPVVDAIFTIIVKIMFMILCVIIIIRCIKHYHEGQQGQLIMSGAIGLLLLAAIIGFSNITSAASALTDAFNFGSKTPPVEK